MKINNCPIHKLAPEIDGTWTDGDDEPLTVVHCPKAVWPEDWDDDGDFTGCKNRLVIPDGSTLEDTIAYWNAKIEEK